MPSDKSIEAGASKWVPCTYCDEDGLIRCGGLPALECPVCFGSKHDYRTEKQRGKDK